MFANLVRLFRYRGLIQSLVARELKARYRGSVHDDEVARRMGYRAALVPGAFLFGHFSRVAIEAWGLDWAALGLAAAIPAVVIYNVLSRGINEYKAQLRAASAQVLLMLSRDLDTRQQA